MPCAILANMGLQRDDEKDEHFHKLKAAVDEYFTAKIGENSMMSEFVLVAQGSAFDDDGPLVRTVFENKGATTNCIGIAHYAEAVLNSYLENLIFPEDGNE